MTIWTARQKRLPTNWFNAFLLLCLCSACATNQPEVNTNVKIDFPSEALIKTKMQADQALEKVALSRAQIDWRFRHMEQICFTRFFMNSCMTNAKNLRRNDLEKVSKIEVAANYFIRKNTVEEMDKALVERNARNPLPERLKK